MRSETRLKVGEAVYRYDSVTVDKVIVLEHSTNGFVRCYDKHKASKFLTHHTELYKIPGEVDLLCDRIEGDARQIMQRAELIRKETLNAMMDGDTVVMGALETVDGMNS